ncbi:antirestriction protein ArdA [Candidatus Pantoea multigeneris]|uniref:Antirestriction protein ArdA n=1 Tax=Candidatus Pantoea multigeneris TaxID=2608357 RepID=A0ABX0RHS2_9GAMM|nr:antirestriction protein ArdA [Pantoea multigeneris]NIF24032.1 antirestriction protein ArdA [Pantoea multigeneris]
MHTVTTPAVYVGTWHKYNCGSIYGKWFDLLEFDDKESFLAACLALHADEADPELMFQDWEGFPGDKGAECSIDWDFIEAFREARNNGMEAAFLAWLQTGADGNYQAFESAYLCEAESEEAYAIETVSDNGLLDSMPSNLRGYFDYEAYARDLFMDGYVFSDGYVFVNR